MEWLVIKGGVVTKYKRIKPHARAVSHLMSLQTHSSSLVFTASISRLSLVIGEGLIPIVRNGILVSRLRTRNFCGADNGFFFYYKQTGNQITDSIINSIFL
ncbi:hypothetical protein Hanom_Chr08g00702211 [Helianthus anomalus]